jgi:hypothetical protein
MATEPTKVKKSRSPRYPGVGLELAIEKTRKLWDAIGKSTVAVDGAIELLGYAPRSGPGTVTLSALKKYGLVEDEPGSKREVKLTPLAQTILLEDEDSEGYRTALREAAKSPAIFHDLLVKFGPELPASDTPMKLWLVRDRGFIETVAVDLVNRFRNTVTFAGLDDADMFAPNEEESDNSSADSIASFGAGGASERAARVERAPQPKSRAGMTTIPVFLVNGDPIYVEGKFPVSESDWVQFLAVLHAMKPGLVAPTGPDPYLGIDEDDDPGAGDFLPDPPDGG